MTSAAIVPRAAVAGSGLRGAAFAALGGLFVLLGAGQAQAESAAEVYKAFTSFMRIVADRRHPQRAPCLDARGSLADRRFGTQRG